MRAGRSVSLDTKVWEAVEGYMHDNGLKDVSSAVEDIARRFLKVKMND